VRTTLTFLSLAAAFLLFGSLYGVSAGFDAAIERVNSNRFGRQLAHRFGWKVGDHVSVMTGPERNQEGTDFVEFDIVGIYEVPSDPESTTRWL